MSEPKNKVEYMDDNDRHLDGSLPDDPTADAGSYEMGDDGDFHTSEADGQDEDQTESETKEHSDQAESETDGQAESNQAILDTFAPTMAESYGVDSLDSDRERELVSVATLPGWPGQNNKDGHGWGEELNNLLGGGLCPGYVLSIGANKAKAGKTAFVMQVVDGLALRTAELISSGDGTEPLTPVLICSEMSPQALSWRTLARWTGHDSRTFRAGESAVLALSKNRSEDEAKRAVEQSFHDARKALGGSLGESRKYMRTLSNAGHGKSGTNLLEHVEQSVSIWVDELKEAHRRPVWPVVVFDPIQRWQEHSTSEVEALNKLIETIGNYSMSDGWIVLLTSDTTKTAATGSDSNAAAAMRGSYKLQHLCEAGILLTAREGDKSKDLKVEFIFNRWGADTKTPEFTWELKTGRFTPTVKDEPQANGTTWGGPS